LADPFSEVERIKLSYLALTLSRPRRVVEEDLYKRILVVETLLEEKLERASGEEKEELEKALRDVKELRKMLVLRILLGRR